MDRVNPFRRVRIGLAALALVLLGGTVGYLLFGFDLIDALYQTVITVTTVGFNSPRPLSAGAKGFTIALILLGVGTALYTFSAVLEVLIEGHMRELVRRRRMERDIARMDRHVIVCGWGRVGREVARFLNNTGRDVVVIDHDPERLSTVPYPSVHGDVTDDEVLHQAGIDRAATLVAALDTDADNLYLTLASKSLRPDLQIIARAAQRIFRSQAIQGGRQPRGESPAARWRPNGGVRHPATRRGFHRRDHARRHAQVQVGGADRFRRFAPGRKHAPLHGNSHSDRSTRACHPAP